MLALWLTWITRVVMIAVLGLFAAPFLWEATSQDSFMTVTGRSMEPTYQVGDVLSVRAPTGHDLETVGEPIVAASTPGDPSTQYVHRVHEVVDGGARLKGDNNSIVDPGIVDERHVVGTPRFALTGAQAVLFAATQSWLLRGIVAVAVLVVIFLPATRSGRHRGPKAMAVKSSRSDAEAAEVDSAPEDPSADESPFAELLRKGTMGCIGLVAALGLAVVFDPSAASASPEPPAEIVPAFEVSPAERLFDIALAPGDVEYATATVTNRSVSPLRVAVSAETVTWEGSNNPSDHILLGATAGHPCPGWGMPVASSPVNAMADFGIGVIAPGAATEVCISALLPPDTALAGWGASVVNLVFSGMGAPSPGLPGAGLPATGYVLSWAVVLGILAALIVGMTLVARGRSKEMR